MTEALHPEQDARAAAGSDVLGSIRRLLAEDRPVAAEPGATRSSATDSALRHRLAGTRRLMPARDAMPRVGDAAPELPLSQREELQAIVIAARKAFEARRTVEPLRLAMDQRVAPDARRGAAATLRMNLPRPVPAEAAGPEARAAAAAIADRSAVSPPCPAAGEVRADPVPAITAEVEDSAASPEASMPKAAMSDRLQEMLTFQAWIAEADLAEDGPAEASTGAVGPADAESETATMPPDTAPNLFTQPASENAHAALLRQLVRDLIHEELQGALGADLSRNLRNLVRGEVRALQGVRPPGAADQDPAKDLG